MAKKSLLDLTQAILNDMNGDEVNSIGDTLESQQVAQIIRDTYDEIISSRTWPHLNQLMSVTPKGAALPTHMDLLAPWTYIDIIKYNGRKATATRDNYTEVQHMYPQEFLTMLDSRNNSSDKVDTVIDPSGIKLFIMNNNHPQFWTTFDDDVLVFDAYNAEVDTNLQESKFQCWGNVSPVWSQTDNFVPDLPAKAFAYLLAEAKSVAFNALMQAGNQKAEQQSRRQRVWLAREKWRANGGMRFPDYGRGSPKGINVRRSTHLDPN